MITTLGVCCITDTTKWQFPQKTLTHLCHHLTYFHVIIGESVWISGRWGNYLSQILTLDKPENISSYAKRNNVGIERKLVRSLSHTRHCWLQLGCASSYNRDYTVHFRARPVIDGSDGSGFHNTRSIPPPRHFWWSGEVHTAVIRKNTVTAFLPFLSWTQIWNYAMILHHP